MVMSSRDFAENLHLSSKNKSLESILKLLQNLQKQNPRVENVDLIRHLVYSPLTSVNKTNVGAHKLIPPDDIDYPLTHDNSQADGINADTTVKKKFGAGAKTDGDSIMAIEHHDNLYPDQLFFSFWIYLPSENTITQFTHLVKKGTSDQYRIGIQSTNALRFFYGIVNGNNNISDILPTDQWVHVVAQSKSGRQELYFDGVLVDSANTTGDLLTNDGDLCIFGQGGAKVREGTIIAHFLMGAGFIDQDWINNTMDGELDVTGTNQVSEDDFGYTPGYNDYIIEYELHNASQVGSRALHRRINEGEWEVIEENFSNTQVINYNNMGSSTFEGFNYEDEITHLDSCPSGDPFPQAGSYNCRTKKWVRRLREITYLPFYNDLEPLPNSDLI